MVEEIRGREDAEGVTPRLRVFPKNWNNPKPVEIENCPCGRKAYRSIKRGTSFLGSGWYREYVTCRRKACRKLFSATSPNKAAEKWNGYAKGTSSDHL